MLISQYIFKRTTLLKVIAVTITIAISQPSYAEEVPLPPKPQIDTIDYFDRLSEGQTLLLRPKVDSVIYNSNIYTLKKNGTLYYSLTDVIDVLNLAVSFNEHTQKGEGWFLREDWNIYINIPEGYITSRDKKYSLPQQDYIEEDNVTFIAQQQIEEWFGFTLDPDIPQQYLTIDSPYPLPIIAKNNRLKKRVNKGMQNKATFPRQKSESKWLDLNTADVQLGTRFNRTQQNKSTSHSTTRQSAIIAAQGQALKHDAYFLSSSNNIDGISAITARLSKRSEDGTLLGPLKARSYTIGDTNLTNIPLLGSTQQEFGFHITNSPLINNQFQTTNINGDSIPDWDVELYRNNILVDVQTTPASGQYEFSEIPLFNGDNEFDIFFYGPQGEIKFKRINIPVNSNLLTAQNGIYNISASLSNARTYQKNDNGKDKNLHLSALYNKKIGNTLAYAGFRSRNIDDKDQVFLGTGFSHTYKDMLIDGNFGLSLEGETAAQLSARRSFKGWNMITRALIQSDNFAPNGESLPAKIKLSSSTQKGFKPTPNSRLNIFSRGSYTLNANEDTITSSQIGGSYQTGNFSLSNSLNYDSFNSSDNDKNTRLSNNLSARLNKGKVFLRGGVNYSFLPEAKADNYFAQINYRPTTKFSGDLNITHRPENNLTEARLNLNHTNDYFRTSPFIEIDSNRDLYAGVNLNFSLIDTPDQSFTAITSKRLIGRGLVSSFVYHDKNGNLKFDEGDEILPDVTVESLNVRRRADTNERGYSLINDLPTNRATDILIDKTTLPDSFMISALEGVSVLPNPGEIIELQFPVHLSGEIDGTVSIKDKENKLIFAKHAEIELHPLESGKTKTIKTKAALDGFYVTSEIPPGRYLMNISDKTAQKNKAGASAPRIVEIGYDGDTHYGYNIELDANKKHIPITVKHEKKLQKNIGERYTINTETQGQSRLSNLLSNYAKSKANSELRSGLQEISTENYSMASNDINSIYNKCQDLANNAIPCAIEVIVTDN